MAQEATMNADQSEKAQVTSAAPENEEKEGKFLWKFITTRW
jgi:hypothetical protein